MKSIKYIRKIHIVIILTLLLSFVLLHIVQAVTTPQAASPGTDGDPIVSQSYVDLKFNDAVRKINETDALIDSLNSTIDNLTTQLEEQKKYATFQVVQLKAGQELTAGASAEIIVRAGGATAVSGVNGDGLSDITSGTGKALFTGDEIPLNHLMLVSRDDGRGLKAVTKDVYILFKGTYTIK